VKRSKSIRLVLIGGLSSGLVTGCGSGDPSKAPISPSAVYTNNYFVPGAGYYHAPFRQWYHVAYNYYEPNSQKYFYGGQWGNAPFESITNISSPTPETAQLVQSQRTDVSRSTGVHRSGFGGTSRTHSVWS